MISSSNNTYFYRITCWNLKEANNHPPIILWIQYSRYYIHTLNWRPKRGSKQKGSHHKNKFVLCGILLCYLHCFCCIILPSDPYPWLFECLFSAFFEACMLYFDVIMIKNELCPLVFSRHCFRRLRSLFFLAWLIRATVWST